MLNKFTSVALVGALVAALCGTSAFANNSSHPNEKTAPASVPAGAPTKKEVKPNEQLKNNMLNLVSDAKAGKVAMAARSQIQPAKSNNWSRGTKIAVGVGIAVAVVIAVIVVVSPALNDGQ